MTIGTGTRRSAAVAAAVARAKREHAHALARLEVARATASWYGSLLGIASIDAYAAAERQKVWQGQLAALPD